MNELLNKQLRGYVIKVKEIMEYCKDYSSNVIVMPRDIYVSPADRTEVSGNIENSKYDVIVSIKDYLLDAGIGYDNERMLFNCIVSDDITEEYAKNFIACMDNVIIPRYENYINCPIKYRYIYELEFNARTCNIKYKRYIQQLDKITLKNDDSPIRYREINTSNKKIKTLSKDVLKKPLASIYRNKTLKVTIWALEKDIDVAKHMLRDYVDNDMRSMLKGVCKYYNAMN